MAGPPANSATPQVLRRPEQKDAVMNGVHEVSKAEPVLHFALQQGTEVRKLSLQPGQVLRIGRQSSCDVLIDKAGVSSCHVELSTVVVADADQLPLLARDCSRNGTGFVHPGTGQAPSPVQPLRSDDPEELHHGSRLVVPFKTKSGDPQDQAILEVQFPAVANGGSGKLNINSCNSCKAKPLQSREHVAAATPPSTMLGEAGGAVSSTAKAEEPPLPAPPYSVTAPKNVDLPDAYDPTDKTGRWRYDARLGEGGLGMVFKAFDCTGGLGEVAVKVLKRSTKNPHSNRDSRHAFAMYRECHWSLLRLHNEEDSRYHKDSADLFARYLEDHTGFQEHGPEDFDGKRKVFEDADFNWEKDGPVLPPKPYVVMELVPGEALQCVIDRERKAHVDKDHLPPLSLSEKRRVLQEAARALEYLVRFDFLHRDFRGCNIHLVKREIVHGICDLKVLDLGVMIIGQEEHGLNQNSAVQAFKRRGDTAEKRKRYDWLPSEVRGLDDGAPPPVNFLPPSHSFDIFSFAVLVLHLLIGKTETRVVLERWKANEGSLPDPSILGLPPELMARMLGEASKRPHPKEVRRALLPVDLLPAAAPEAVSPSPAPMAVDLEEPPADAPSKASPNLLPRKQSRSRSRSKAAAVAGKGSPNGRESSVERKQRERREKWRKACVANPHIAA